MPDLGDLVTLQLTVSPFSGTTAAALLVTAPDGTTSTPTATTADGGATWTATLTYTQAGWWKIKWTVTGTGAGVQYEEVHVDAAPTVPATTPLIGPLEQFKNWLRYGTNADRDDELLTVLTSATEWAMWKLGGPLTVTTFTERLQASGIYLRQRKHPLVAVVSLTPQDGSALSSSAYIVDTTNSLVQLRFNSSGWYTLVYQAGLTQVSRRKRLAGFEVARHLWNVQNGSAGRGFPPEELVDTPMGFAVPRRAEELLLADPDNQLMPGFA